MLIENDLLPASRRKYSSWKSTLRSGSSVRLPRRQPKNIRPDRKLLVIAGVEAKRQVILGLRGVDGKRREHNPLVADAPLIAALVDSAQAEIGAVAPWFSEQVDRGPAGLIDWPTAAGAAQQRSGSTEIWKSAWSGWRAAVRHGLTGQRFSPRSGRRRTARH